MDAKKIVVIVVVVSLLVIGTLAPAPARADTAQALTLAGIAIAAYVVAVVIATAIVYRKPFMDGPPALDRDADKRDLHFATHCRQQMGNVTVACW